MNPALAGRYRSHSARLRLPVRWKTGRIVDRQLERFMHTTPPEWLRTEYEADLALIQWKAMFARTVVENAQRYAAQSAADTVTLADYRQAARQALIKLAALIEKGEPVDVS